MLLTRLLGGSNVSSGVSYSQGRYTLVPEQELELYQCLEESLLCPQVTTPIRF